MLKRLLGDPTRLNILINTVGNYLNVFFTALFALILVRILTPAEYGDLSVLLGISYVMANVLDFGTTATIYSIVPGMYAEGDKHLFRFIKSTFFYQSIFSFIIIGILFVAFPYLDLVFFKTEAPLYTLYLTTFSVLFFIWQNFLTNILLAAKKFVRANIYINIANLVKTAVILILAYFGYVSVGSVIFVFGIVGPLVFFVLVLLINKNKIGHLHRAAIDRKEFRFGYTITYFLASQFYNLGLRMDLFMLSFFGMQQEVGYYGLSQKIILTVITSIISITQVLSPRFATIKTKSEAGKQLKRAFVYLLFPSLIFVVLYFTPKFVFELIFTSKFVKTQPVTQALSLPFILAALGSAPMLFLLYTVKRPIYILISNIVFFIIITLGSWYLIPTMGMFGPPHAIWWAYIGGTLVLIVATVREYRRFPQKQ